MENLEWSTYPEINQAPPPYSMLQHIERVVTPKLAPRNCLRYLQTALTIEGKGIGLRIYVRYCRLIDFAPCDPLRESQD